MNKFLKYPFAIFFILLFGRLGAQCLISEQDLDVRFLIPKVEIEAGKTYFNILVVQNKSPEEIEFNVNYNVPRDWRFIGTSNETIVIPPHEKMSLPVHVTATKDAVGGVGYVIVAVVSDKLGTLFKTEYSFLNIPIKAAIKVSPVNKNNYFDKKTLNASYYLKISNNGNIDEIINIKLEPDITLIAENTSENFYFDNFPLRSHTDTIVRYSVKLKSDDEFKNFSLHRMNVNISGEDTVINRIAWFRYLNSDFVNYIQDTDYPLIIELTALNIFSEFKAEYIGRVYGNILLKKKKSVSYSFENWQRETDQNLWINSRILIGYKDFKNEIYFGDLNRNFEINMFGRGVSFTHKITKRNIISLAVTERLPAHATNYGGSMKHIFRTNGTLELGGGYSENNDNFSASKLIYQRTTFNIINSSQRINFLLGLSNTDFRKTSGVKPYGGYGVNVDYNGNIKNVNVNLTSYYGTPGYAGYSQSRLFVNGAASLNIGERKNVYLLYANTRYSPLYLSGNEYISDRFTSYQNTYLQYRYTPDNNIFLYGGPSVIKQESNSFSGYLPSDIFSTYTAKAEFSIKISEKYTYNSVTLTGRYGMTFIDKYSRILNGNYIPELKNTKPFNIAELVFGVRRKYSKIHFIYYHGPNNISQQFAYFYSYYF